MDGEIQFLKYKNLGRYLQSLDSVRFIESDKNISESKSKIDIFVSLMFGRTIAIGEHQFIDSFGLLKNAFDLIKAFQSIGSYERSQVKQIFPFQLYFRDSFKNINELLAEKLGDPNYKLSLWEGISSLEKEKMIETRRGIKEKILNKTFDYENDNLVLKEDYDAAMMLREVQNKFEQGERNQLFTLYGEKSVDFTIFNGLLPKGIKEIIGLTESDIDFELKRQEKIKKNGYEIIGKLEPDLKSHTLKLINTLKKLQLKGLNINNRSNIRGSSGQKENNEILIIYKDVIGDNFIYDGILEIFDSLYNSSIAKASFAHSESVSSARDYRRNLYIRAANSLVTMIKNQITDQASIEGEYFNPSWIQGTDFITDTTNLDKRMLSSMPWEKIWYAFLDKNWRNSVSRLNAVLKKWDNLINNPTTSEQEYIDIENELNDAYSQHINSISNILKDTGWDFLKEQNKIKITHTTLSEIGGILASKITSFVLDKVALDLSWEETLPYILPEAVGVGTAIGLEFAKEPVGQLFSRGYIRKTFERIIDEKGL